MTLTATYPHSWLERFCRLGYKAERIGGFTSSSKMFVYKLLAVCMILMTGCCDEGISENETEKSAISLARGFGEHIEWKNLAEGLAEAEKRHMPAMVIVHKSWCGACQALKPKFSTSSEISELSKKFLMINLEDDEEPQDKQYHLDGSYIPRIYFLDSTGKVQKDIYNEQGNANYKYFYPDTQPIIESMKSALEKMIEGVRIGDEL